MTAPLRIHRDSGAPPFVTAHRGLSSQAPENTLAAFRRAVEAGADMLELDVHLTADDRVAVIHDRTLQRTTTGNGGVRSYTSGEISEFDAGSWFDPEFTTERVPMLEDVLAVARDRCLLNVELKSHAFHQERPGIFERRVLDAVRNGGMLDRTIFTSFDHRLVRGIREVEPSAVTGILYHWHS
ncbi:MAG: glycerophosphodiester phosphodiesterase family protein, partial [Bacteroidota bacterium]